MAGSLTTEPLRPNRPDVIDENFEGETVIVNLNSGCYFALSSAATVLWGLLAKGRSGRSLAESVDADESTVAAFLSLLAEEKLTVPGDVDAGVVDPIVSLGGVPTLEKFTDMQELLMLDPIHDIELDGDGWPVAQQT